MNTYTCVRTNCRNKSCNSLRMKKTLLFVLALSGLSALSAHIIIKEYHFRMYSRTWAQALSVCREGFTDLATVDNQDDNSRLLSAWMGPTSSAWIGLYDHMKRWKWALGNEDFNNEFSPWYQNEPKNGFSNESCVVMKEDGQWHDDLCSQTKPSVCYYERGPAKYILVQAKMTWENARTYCRSKYTDLASVRNTSESSQITSLMSEGVWIGLHRKPWAHWSDQSPKTFSNWNTNQPRNSNTAATCAVVDRDGGKWRNVDCNRRRHFICQKITYHPHKNTTFKLKFQSEADLNDPAVQQQILAQLHGKLEKQGLSDFKLHWIQTDGQTFHKEQESKKEKGDNYLIELHLGRRK